MREQMINYLQSMMDEFKKREARLGIENDYTVELLDKMIACKEMVETLIGEPVNLQMDGKVTVGF